MFVVWVDGCWVKVVYIVLDYYNFFGVVLSIVCCEWLVVLVE